MINICVVGAGIIGLSTAVVIQQKYGSAVSVTLIADKFSPNTTGDGAAGLWGPYLLGDTPHEKIRIWSEATHDFLESLWKSEDAGRLGISLIPCYRVNVEVEPLPAWKNTVYGFREMPDKEIQKIGRPGLRQGISFVTYICECSKFLPYLLEEFRKNRGNVVEQTIKNWAQLVDTYDIIVDCSGIRARDLAGDRSVAPKRGQVMRVTAPWIKAVILDDSDDGNYVIPNMDSVVLGGTHQEGDWNMNIYPEDTQFILEGCQRLVPALKHVPVQREWVGLRPGRPSVRLDREVVRVKNRKVTVIHNYGHGGSGVTLFWGCAKEAADLVGEALSSKLLKSRL
ncbi:D-aspartate oxidase-like [Artemia franciscana]|uniref:D-aspartate oxidase-like n=1 Tax=Artemia franciscana TaxID=6661 RepID=UPI0032DB57C9